MKTAEEILPKGEDIALYQGDYAYNMIDRDTALKAMREYASQKQEWIPVSERLPENSEEVLCFGDCRRFSGFYTKGHEVEFSDDDYDGDYDPIEDKNGTLYLKPGWYECVEQTQAEYDSYFFKRIVIHWQPLPPKPKQ